MRRDRHDQGGQGCRSLYYFNPHSHEGSDLVTDSPPFSCSISIHTPTKGATHFFLQLRQSFSYFNPHSHEGSDASFTIAFSFCVNFNPHSHEGSDRHTLQDDKLRQNFNPHSHEGSDSVASMSFASFPVFQSTLPRRERRFFILHVIVHNNFNPHSHEGSDPKITRVHSLSKKFQSTLPRRERRILL